MFAWTCASYENLKSTDMKISFNDNRYTKLFFHFQFLISEKMNWISIHLRSNSNVKHVVPGSRLRYSIFDTLLFRWTTVHWMKRISFFLSKDFNCCWHSISTCFTYSCLFRMDHCNYQINHNFVNDRQNVKS